MRILNFIVNKQSIRKDPNCDFSGLIPGTEGYLHASFVFSYEWNNCKKAVEFTNSEGSVYAPLSNSMCQIPSAVLKNRNFKVKVIGEREGYRILTNRIEVRQNGR